MTDYQQLWRRQKQENLKLWRENYVLKEVIRKYEQDGDKQTRQDVEGEDKRERPSVSSVLPKPQRAELSPHSRKKKSQNKVGLKKRDTSMSKTSHIRQQAVRTPER